MDTLEIANDYVNTSWEEFEEKYKEILLQHREYLHDWMKLHHVAQIRKDVHTIPGVNPE